MDSGVSRAEMLEALIDVKEGRLPRDELSLQVLLEELRSWYGYDDNDEEEEDEETPPPDYSIFQG